LFASHIVDEEVAANVSENAHQNLFDSEEDYYQDIQASKFGITTRRAGWDCLRHYEIAANGTVICFKDLANKPASCAPHNLIDGKNCIAYTDYSNLINKISVLSGTDYENLQRESLNWVHNNSTILRVEGLVNKYYLVNR
jgi:hypothetical protein